ncbi:MAG: transcription antitermination factor NusB [Candidatus Margulisbacteria bacterium]|nr:transcription antitermination factor NusB [Candidatus Margulisiibacteriota bacterium]MBU1616898.1 transcription antitermination factor NusB [Candidatus Margulisiibacteriota bacterium]MBU1867304.1 transcription antitermination factor NusB [Candidatus Margulisiibacteriota bacterium]
MGKRTTSRRLAMQAIYQAEISNNSIEEALKNLFESEKFIDETIGFSEKLAKQAWADREWSDQIIAKFSVDWPLDRIGKVDRSILRLSFSELKAAETPPSVVVNEAVELAKKYSSEEAAKFINGILGAYLRLP